MNISLNNIYIIVCCCLLFSCGGKGDDSIVNTVEPWQSTTEKYVEISFPSDLKTELIGKKIKIKNTLYIVSSYGVSGRPEGNVILSSEILRSPTDITLPGSNDYLNTIKANKNNTILLSVPASFVLTDAITQTLRCGATVSGLQGTLTYNINTNGYTLEIDNKPVITGNERPSVPTASGYNLKIASMNLDYYIASPNVWGKGYGANNAIQFNRQHSKIMAALKELDADIFALCEVQEGNYSVNKLTKSLNDAFGLISVYKFVDSGDTGKLSTNIKNIFIYNSAKVKPYKDFKVSYDAGSLKLRHVAQCFELVSNGAKVILGMNHFKAKSSGNGENADQGDGQGKSNSTRKEEASQCVKAYESMKTFYGDPDVLVLGDLNSYSQEDPIRIFINAGYTNELIKYSPNSWSYHYGNEVGYLDQSLSSTTLTSQIIKSTPWDVNASEPIYFEYQYESYFQNNPYRCSDHNPIITFLNLK